MKKKKKKQKHLHSWKEIGNYDAGFGISSSWYIIYWCTDCGSIKKSYSSKIIKPKDIK